MTNYIMQYFIFTFLHEKLDFFIKKCKNKETGVFLLSL